MHLDRSVNFIFFLSIPSAHKECSAGLSFSRQGVTIQHKQKHKETATEQLQNSQDLSYATLIVASTIDNVLKVAFSKNHQVQIVKYREPQRFGTTAGFTARHMLNKIVIKKRKYLVPYEGLSSKQLKSTHI